MHALIDAELYTPHDSWMRARARCAAAGVPAERDFATNPEPAHRMIERALHAQVPFAWVLGDTVYSASPILRAWLEKHGLNYALAVARTCTVHPVRGTGC